MPSSSVYLGIDVCCAVGKKLPICVLSADNQLMPLSIPKHLAALIPRGVGNKEIIAATPFQEVARGVLSAITQIADEMGWKVERIAVDAPAAPPATGTEHRKPNSHGAVCPPSKHPRRPPGQSYARSAPIICA